MSNLNHHFDDSPHVVCKKHKICRMACTSACNTKILLEPKTTPKHSPPKK